MRRLFISDLHLDPKRTDIQDCFEQFIDSCLDCSAAEEYDSKIDALYILGDLFEVWIGDDASIPFYQKPVTQLKQLTNLKTAKWRNLSEDKTFKRKKMLKQRGLKALRFAIKQI